MDANEQEIEKEIQEKNLNAPRLTPDHIDSVIANEEFFIVGDHKTTICILTLKNGFKVDGSSYCVSPENFDESLGRKISKKNAREKIWALEGYLLQAKLAFTFNG